MVKQQVFWLQVPMNHSKFMNILNTREYLRIHFAGLDLLEPSILDDVLEQFATRAILHDEV